MPAALQHYSTYSVLGLYGVDGRLGLRLSVVTVSASYSTVFSAGSIFAIANVGHNVKSAKRHSLKWDVERISIKRRLFVKEIIDYRAT